MAKDTASNVKRQAVDLEKIFYNENDKQRLEAVICKELSVDQINNPIEK